MDSYCIDRGTVLDKYLTETLLEPEQHSIHCLVDVDRCAKSGYQMLLDSADINGNNKHCRVLQLDAFGTNQMRALAQATGEGSDFCETCTGARGSQTHGFRATVFGTIPSISGDDNDDGQRHKNPPTMKVSRVEPASFGCNDGNDGAVAYVPTIVNCDSGSYLPFIASHGTLMLLSWGFLLPGGVVAARFLKHKPDSLWFKMHRVLQPTGLFLALAGWITAFVGPFDVLGSGIYDTSFAHAVLGTVVMILGLLQPLNAWFRPHKPNDGDPAAPVSPKRKRWECTHKTVGYFCVGVGIVNCFIGMALSGKFADYFLYSLISSLAFLALVIGVACLQRRSKSSGDGEDEDKEGSDSENDNIVDVMPDANENEPLTTANE